MDHGGMTTSVRVVKRFFFLPNDWTMSIYTIRTCHDTYVMIRTDFFTNYDGSQSGVNQVTPFCIASDLPWEWRKVIVLMPGVMLGIFCITRFFFPPTRKRCHNGRYVQKTLRDECRRRGRQQPVENVSIEKRQSAYLSRANC